MRQAPLSGLSVLVVEDDPLIALDVECELIAAGARVIGPVATLEHAMATAETERIDIAILDIDLGRKEVFPAAEILRRRSIPFLFYTGMPDRAPLRDTFAAAPVCVKPAPHARLIATLESLAAQPA